MRILTVRQPWAGAIIYRGKDVENRTRNIAGDYRGPVAVHVGLRYDYSGVGRHNEIAGHLDDHSVFGYGHIIGVVDLTAVHHADWCWDHDGVSSHYCSEWGDGDAYHLKLANPRALATPIPYKGALGLRELPEDVAAQVLAGVAS